MDSDSTRSSLQFYVNGVKRVLDDVQPDTTLLEYLRSAGLTGTKLGCGEGGCGACTVTVSSFDPATQSVLHKPVNACLAPLCTMDDCQVTTVEGIGSVPIAADSTGTVGEQQKGGLHPVQQRIADFHGSQCGYCTPGIVMSMYTLLQNNAKPTLDDVEEAWDGNLCRCTGYRPLLDAARTFCTDKDSTPSSGACSGGKTAGVYMVSGSNSNSNSNAAVRPTSPSGKVPDTESSGDETVTASADAPVPPEKAVKLVVSDSRQKVCDETYTSKNKDDSESYAALPFPEDLRTMTPTALSIKGERVAWYAPVTLQDLLEVKQQHPDAKLIVGNTEVGIETKFKHMKYSTQVGITRVPELNILRLITPAESAGWKQGGVLIGGAVTLGTMLHFIKQIIAERKDTPLGYTTRALAAIAAMSKWFASTPIRSVAAVCGNIATASPISDLNPMLMACGAVLHIVSATNPTGRMLPMSEFFLGYRKTDMAKDEIIKAVHVPLTASQFEYVLPYKQARRREDDITIANAGLRVSLTPQSESENKSESESESSSDNTNTTAAGCWKVAVASFCYGGMAATTVSASGTMAAATGAAWTEENLHSLLLPALDKDMPLPDDVPGGMPTFRRTLSRSFLYKFYVAIALQLKQDIAASENPGSYPAAPIIAPKCESAADTFVTGHRPVSTGVQEYTTDTKGGLQKFHPSLHAVDNSTPHNMHHLAQSAADKAAAVTASSTGRGGEPVRAPVGQPLRHQSAALQVTGEALYTDDEVVPANTAECSFVLSGKANCRITKIDPSPALAMPGVLAFFTAADVPGHNQIGAIVKDELLFRGMGVGVAEAGSAEGLGTVHAVGQPIGLIVAETRQQAQAASLAVVVDYEALPALVVNPGSRNDNGAIVTIQDAISYSVSAKEGKSGAQVVEDKDLGNFYGRNMMPIGTDSGPENPHNKTTDSSFCAEHAIEQYAIKEKASPGEDQGVERVIRHTVNGDMTAALAGCDTVVEGDIRIGAQEHFYLECNAALVVPGEGVELRITSSTQNPTKTQNFVAYVLGIPAMKIVSRTKRMGGGFGGKETRSAFVACAAALASHKLRRPCRINLDRNEDMAIVGARHAFVGKYRAGVKKIDISDAPAGTCPYRLEAMDVQLYSNGGYSFDLSVPVMDRALLHLDNVYKFDNFRAVGRVARTACTSATAFRGFGGPQGLMVCESAIEHLAHTLQVTPQALRTANLYKEGDLTPFGQTLEDCNIRGMWSDMVKNAHVADRETQVADFNAKHRWKKRGICLMPNKFGINFTAKFMNQGGALVHVYTDGTVLVNHGGTEMGQGLNTKMIQIAARCFGISADCVTVAETSTDKVANASPTAASMSTDLYGMAVLDACEQINARLAPIWASFEAASDGGGVAQTFKDVVMTAFFDRVDLSAHGYYAVPGDRCGFDFEMDVQEHNKERGMPFNYFTYGVACAEVEVDILTGDMHMIRVDILMDLGSSINPALDIGQIEGAFIQGFGWCTMEEMVWGDSEHKWVRPGHLFTQGPGTYKIPSFNDVPLDFRVRLTSNYRNKFAVHSSKAVGEPPLFLGSAAFWATKSAIYEARKEEGLTGHFVLDSPCTSERIRVACTDSFTGGKDVRPKGSF